MNNRIVEIDNNSGFCFGVVYAIEMAEDYLRDNDQLYCLGDIVHNDEEVNRLHKQGLRIIDHSDLENLRDATVLIRAHGEPPSTYIAALENNITLIDASCPVVLKLQNRVRSASDAEVQIVIYGKPGHAEVKGLMGQTNNNAILISCEEDLEKIDFSKPLSLFSQTTKSTKNFYRIRDLIKEKQENARINDTICRQVSNREPELKKFATKYDSILFVAGKKSSNGKVLFEACKSMNANTHFVSSVSEIDESLFHYSTSIGICGATSTPMWLMEAAADFLRELPPVEARA